MKRDGDERKKEEKYRVKVKLNRNEKYELNGGSRRCLPTTKHGFNKSNVKQVMKGSKF